MLTLADLLADQLLDGAVCLAVPERLPDRVIRWFSVIEWPVEDFVQEGDLVMTTGLGCDSPQFVDLIDQVVASEPAGVFVSLAPQSPIDGVPVEATDRATAAGIPLVQIPWRVRFAEIARAVVDRVTIDSTPAVDGLGSEYVAALLGEHGLGAIVEIAEQQTGDAVVVLGADLRVESAGPLAHALLGERLEACTATAEQLATTTLLALRSALENPAALADALDRLGLPEGAVVAAIGSRRRGGYIYAPGLTGDGVDGRIEPLRQAAQAVAVEQVRARAIAEADVRTHGDLLWAIARGDVTDRDDILRRAALIGHERSTTNVVAAGLLSTGSSASNDAVTLDAVTLPRLRRHGVQASRAEDGVLVVARSDGPNLLQLLADAPGATWGVADRAVPLTDLRGAYVRALDVAIAARVLGRRSGVSAERNVGPYLLLTRLREDPACSRAVHGLLEQLLAYDRRTSRDLARTLEVYLAASGNTSGAARTLHLNRHSLRYRLQKIESLTGRSLADPDDRFLLDLALRLWRIEGTHSGSQPSSTPGE